MKELDELQLRELEGGVVGADDVVFALAMTVIVGVLNDWDGFKKGIMSAFYF